MMAQQTPEILSLDKYSAGTGEVVTIKGDGFGDNAANIKVTFGAVRATVVSVENQEIQVKVPAGATYDEVAVTNTSTNLTGYSKYQFLLSFGSGPAPAPFDPANDLAAPVNYNTGPGVSELCMCDIDLNGKPEIFTSNAGISGQAAGNMTHLNNIGVPGTVSFSALNKVINNSFRLARIKCADINSDGIPDIVVTEEVRDRNGRIAVIKNGNISDIAYHTLNPIPGLISSRSPMSVDVADMDMDGLADIIISDIGNRAVTILRNSGSYTFEQIDIVFPNEIVISGTEALAVGDLNADGKPDIITSKFNTSANNIFIIPNISTPGNISWGAIITGEPIRTCKYIRIGDVDGDLKPEIIASDWNTPSSLLTIIKNQTSAPSPSLPSPPITFGTARTLPLAQNAWGLDMGDLNGDGKAEIVVAHTSGTQQVLRFFNNPGNINDIQPGIDFAVSDAVAYVKIGDADGDGKPDVAYAAASQNKVYILRNRRCVIPELSPEGPHEVCTGATLQLSSNERPGATYVWEKDNVPVGGATNSTYSIPTVAVSPAANYTLTIIADGCTEESDPIQVTVSNGTISGTPVASNTGPACEGGALTLEVTDVDGSEYRWTGPNGFSFNTSTDPPTDAVIGSFQPQQAGRYYVDVMKGTCVAARVSTLVEVVYVPDFTVNPGGSTIFCDGGTKSLTVAPTPDGYTFQWYETTSGELAGETDTDHLVSASGEYYVKAKYTSCSVEKESSRIAITEAAVPNAAFEIPATACKGAQIQITNHSTTDPVVNAIYSWEFGDESTSLERDPLHTYPDAGNYTVRLMISYAGGLCPDELSKSITIQAAPTINIINPENTYTFCEGDSIRLEVPGAFLSYAWSTSSTTPFIYVKETGNYMVDVTTAGCTLHAEKEVTTITKPVVVITANPPKIEEGQSTQLSVSGIETYEWSPGETLSDPTIASPVATPLITTDYSVKGTDAFGCYGESAIKVEVKGDFIVNKLEPRSFFSPNEGDQINALWKVNKIEDYPVCNVTIYDEKGAKVFEAKPYQNDWNGTFNGKLLPDGVYYYIIRCDGEESNPRSGSITLLR